MWHSDTFLGELTARALVITYILLPITFSYISQNGLVAFGLFVKEFWESSGKAAKRGRNNGGTANIGHTRNNGHERIASLEGLDGLYVWKGCWRTYGRIEGRKTKNIANELENDRGHLVDLYIPRHCSATS
jgi:hypothetical protein